MKQPVMRTLHRPGKCDGKAPECRPNHWFAVRAMDIRGTWNLLDMLDRPSLEALYITYKMLRGA